MKSESNRIPSERTVGTTITATTSSSSSSTAGSRRKKESNNTNNTGNRRVSTKTRTKKQNDEYNNDNVVNIAVDDKNDNNDNNTIFVVESQNVPYSNHRSTSSILWTVLDSMNPRTCLQPTTNIITTTTTATTTTSSSAATSNPTNSTSTTRSVVTAATDTLLACHLPGISEPPPIDDIVEPLLEKIRIPKYRTNALHKLYRLTDRNRKYNRIPIVCTTKYDIIGIIARYCLVVDNDNPVGGVVNPDRRQALLFINNLCIPVENKATILYGPSNEILISSILRIIHKRLPEAYIGLVTFLNLAVLNDEAKQRLLLYVPSIRPDVVDVLNNNLSTIKEAPSTYEFQKSPITPKNSLVHIIEQCIQDYIPYIDIDPIKIMGCSTKPSVEQEFIRWSMNLFRTLVGTVPENASIIVNETIIAQVAGYCLYTSVQKQLRQQQRDEEDKLKSPKNHSSGGILNRFMTGSYSYEDNDNNNTTNEDTDDDDDDPITISVLTWTKESVEDASLMLLIHCAQYDDCIESLQEIKDLQWTLQQIQQYTTNQDGIHTTRAIALCQRLFT